MWKPNCLTCGKPHGKRPVKIAGQTVYGRCCDDCVKRILAK